MKCLQNATKYSMNGKYTVKQSRVIHNWYKRQKGYTPRNEKADLPTAGFNITSNKDIVQKN